MTIGQRIKSLRQKKNWTQKDLGERLGINWTNITRYEKDKIKPSMKMLKKFADAFEIPADKLVYDEEETKPELFIQDKELLKQFIEVEKMDEDDKAAIKKLIQAMIVKNQVCDLAKSA
jgi:transcriptional regulator with XRE-family HTH domain